MRSTAPSLSFGAYRPRYGLMDIIGLLFRELWLMILIFIIVFALGAAAVMLVKKTYVAGASIYAGTGQEYVYQPRVGVSERAAPPTPGEVAQSEAAILNSRAVKLRAVRALGVTTFQTKPSTDPMEKQEGDAIRAINTGLIVGTAPLSPIIGLSYESDSAEKSAKILNAVIAAYLSYRREVFQDKSTAAIDTQRGVFEDELSAVDSAYERFLASNDIGDFATAKASVAATYQSIFTDRLSVQAQLSQASRRLATLQAQQAGTPREIAVQQDLNVSAQDQILQLRTEREQLLARYQPGSQPILDIEARIQKLQTYVSGGDTVGAKEVRLGPNQVWTELETTRINAAADRDALAARLGALDQQLAALSSRQARLTQLESQNAILTGNREVLTASIREFQQRGAQNRADNDLVKGGVDNVRVLDQAAPPTKGNSLKLPLMGLAFLFAGFTALCVGLFRVFARRGFATPGSAGRTLQMPVLAVAPLMKAPRGKSAAIKPAPIKSSPVKA